MAREKKVKRPGERQQDRKKAYYLRAKIDKGGSLDVDQSAWLAEYEAATGKSSPPAAAAPPEPESTPAPGPEPENVPVDDPPIEPLPVDLPEPPPLDPPPRAAKEPEPERKGRGGSWQDKYRQTAGSPIKSDGREEVCCFIGEQWVGVLEAMCESMRDAGIKPIIEPAMLRNSIVLTIDEMLPAAVALTPRKQAVIGTSALVIQRWARGKAINEARKEKTERDAHKSKIDKMKERTARDEAAAMERERQRNAAGVAPMEPAVTPAPAPAPVEPVALAIVKTTVSGKVSADDVY